MTRSVLAFLLILPLSLFAQRQKKNVIKPVCIASDYLAETGNTPFEFSYSFEYERQFSPRMAFNVSYHKFLLKNQDNGYYRAPGISGKDFISGNYSEEFTGFGYESRYYFNDFDSDGTSSGYMGFVYQLVRATQTLTDARYEDNITGTNSIVDFPEEHFTIHRPGIRIGHVWQGALYSDLYVGIFYNIRSDYSTNTLTPFEVKPVSLMLGWNIGIPF
ncbi:MAG: hypothetical protein V4658_01270 [Bacteroidota bacterium]